ncbi:MAG: hypothetical protein ACYCY6_02765 [Minisyncoccota bacterium]
MSTKIIWLLMIVGSALGGYLPLIWGGSVFSFTSIFLTALGGATGIYIGYKLSR